MRKETASSRFPKSRLRLQRLRKVLGIAIALFLGWLVSIAVSLGLNAAKPIDAVLVLGGSIQREIYAAELALRSPTIPILISRGSDAPCIWNIFQQAQAPMEKVWLEECADSTFENFCFSVPTLRQWKAHKIKLVTSKTHLPRAKWLAQLMLGAHRIAVETEVVVEKGVPGNRESAWKTGLDLTRGLGWAVISQIHSAKCSRISLLKDVEMAVWLQKGFHCERRIKSRRD